MPDVRGVDEPDRPAVFALGFGLLVGSLGVSFLLSPVLSGVLPGLGDPWPLRTVRRPLQSLVEFWWPAVVVGLLIGYASLMRWLRVSRALLALGVVVLMSSVALAVTSVGATWQRSDGRTARCGTVGLG